MWFLQYMCDSDSQMIIVNILMPPILTCHASIERRVMCVLLKMSLTQCQVIYSQCHAPVLIPISLLPYLLVLQR